MAHIKKSNVRDIDVAVGDHFEENGVGWTVSVILPRQTKSHSLFADCTQIGGPNKTFRCRQIAEYLFGQREAAFFGALAVGDHVHRVYRRDETLYERWQMVERDFYGYCRFTKLGLVGSVSDDKLTYLDELGQQQWPIASYEGYIRLDDVPEYYTFWESGLVDGFDPTGYPLISDVPIDRRDSRFTEALDAAVARGTYNEFLRCHRQDLANTLMAAYRKSGDFEQAVKDLNTAVDEQIEAFADWAKLFSRMAVRTDA